MADALQTLLFGREEAPRSAFGDVLAKWPANPSDPNDWVRKGPYVYDPNNPSDPNDWVRKGPYVYDPNNPSDPNDFIKLL